MLPSCLISDNDKNTKIWERIYENFFLFPSNYPRNKLLKYSTNIPFLFTCMELLPHNKIIEFGTGLFSTPILYEYFVDKFFAVEDEEEWFEKLKETYANKQGFIPLLPGFYFGNKGPGKKLGFNDLNEDQKKMLSEYYSHLVEETGHVDFVLIDQAQYARSQSIVTMHEKSSVIVYHDSQYVRRYNYDIVNQLMASKKYKLYSYSTIPSWTNMLIDDSFNLDQESFSCLLKKKEELYFRLISYKEPEFAQQLSEAKFKFERVL